MEHIQTDASAAHPYLGQRGYVTTLVLGDILAFLIFADLGRRSHGAAAGLSALFEVIKTAAPFLLGWFAVAPWLKAYRDERLTSNPNEPQQRGLLVRTMLQRTTLAWLVACPVGLVLRALFLWRGIPVSFAIVTFASTLLILGGWRALFAWLVSHSRVGFLW